jgi:hypothetical protein
MATAAEDVHTWSYNTTLSIKILLKIYKITGILHFLIVLRLVADKHNCHYCHLHSVLVFVP